MNRWKRILTGAIAASLMSIVISFQAFGARIAFSDPSAEAGSEVTVNMKITAADGETINSSNVMLAYDPSALQFISGTGATGDAGAIRVAGESQSGSSTELSFTLTFRALRPGSTNISVSSQEVYDRNGQIVTVGQEGSSAVTITGEAVALADAALSGLQISPGTLSPAFSPDVEHYTAVVGGDVDQVVVEASAADTGASVSVSGGENLQLGENEIVCTVTGSDGQATRTYRIMVTKVEGEAGVPAADQVALKVYERNLTVISAQEGMEIPNGFVQCSITIDGQAVQGWIWGNDENPEYCIFYAINEDGERGFYRYDLTEKTLQRYFQDPAAGGEFEEKFNATAQEYNSLLRDYEIRFWIIIGLIALAVALLVVIIVLVAGRVQRDDFIEKKEAEEEWEPRRRGIGQRMTKEEQYLRDLEEEEEEQEEEEYSYARRVQDEDGDESYVVRGGAYEGQAYPGGAGNPRAGSQIRRAGDSQPQRGAGAGARGNGQAVLRGPGDFGGGGPRGATTAGNQAGGPRGTGSTGALGGRRPGPAERGQEPRRTVPAGETQAVYGVQGRGNPQAGGPNPRAGYGGRAGAASGPRGAVREQMDMGADEDFEVINLE